MNILNFLLQNWDSVLVIVAAIALFVFLYIKGEKKIIYTILFNLITEAERVYGSGTGKLKLASVLTSIYEKLPTVVKLVVTENRLVEWIEDVLQQAKKKWAENAAIAEYIGTVEVPVEPEPEENITKE